MAINEERNLERESREERYCESFNGATDPAIKRGGEMEKKTELYGTGQQVA